MSPPQNRRYPSSFIEQLECEIWRQIGYGDVKVELRADHGSYCVRHRFNGVVAMTSAVAGETAEMCIEEIVEALEDSRARYLSEALKE